MDQVQSDVAMALLLVTMAVVYLRLLVAGMHWAASDESMWPDALSREAQAEREAAFLAQFTPARREYPPHAPHVGSREGTGHLSCERCGEDCLHDGRCCWCGYDANGEMLAYGLGGDR